MPLSESELFLIVIVMTVGLLVAIYELGESLKPPRCPRCAHCAELREQERRRQEELQRELDSTYRLHEKPSEPPDKKGGGWAS